MRRAAIAIAAASVLFASGCGGGGADQQQDLAKLAPADAQLYLESVVRPQGTQREAIDALTSRVGGIQNPGDAIVQRLDASLAQSSTDVTYQDDIAPWLGERAAVFVQSLTGAPPDFAVVLETTDAGAAQDFLDKVTASSSGVQHETYNGVDYVQGSNVADAAGIVDDFLVFGTVNGFHGAVDASSGSSLADSSAFDNSVSAISSDNLGLGYVDLSSAAEALLSGQVNPLEAQLLNPVISNAISGPATFAVSAAQDTAKLDIAVPTGTQIPAISGGSLLSRAPADSWFALAIQDLGQTLGPTLERASLLPGVGSVADRFHALTGLDVGAVLSWAGDTYGFVSGTSKRTFAAGVVADSADPAAPKQAVTTFQDKVRQDADAKLGPPLVQGADAGFSFTAPESPLTGEMDAVGNTVVGAFGPHQPGQNALHPSQTLADDASYRAGTSALGSDFSPTAFVSLSPFFTVAAKGGSASDPNFRAARPYLDKLDYLMLGTRTEGDRSISRFVVGVK
jgi:hypothetical protein